MKLIKKIFAPAEVKVSFKAMKIAERSLNNGSFFIVKPYVEELLLDTARTIYTIQEEKIKPSDLVHLLITNALDKVLCSGQFHIYRGSLNSTGHQLLHLWDQAVDYLKHSGFFTAEKAQEDKSWIRDQIKQVG